MSSLSATVLAAGDPLSHVLPHKVAEVAGHAIPNTLVMLLLAAVIMVLVFPLVARSGSRVPSGARNASYRRRASSRRNGTRNPSSPRWSRGLRRPPPTASNTSRTSATARGWRSVTKALSRLETPVSLLGSAAARGISFYSARKFAAAWRVDRERP